MLQEQEVRAGAVLIWQPMECHRDQLRFHLDRMLFHAVEIPAREDSSLLAGAMLVAATELMPPDKGESYYTKPRLKSVAIELYHLKKGDRDTPNVVRRVMSGSLADDYLDITLEDWVDEKLKSAETNDIHRVRSAVRASINHQMGIVSKDGVTSMMVKMVEAVGGYPFRGGAYYLPTSGRDRFETFLNCCLSAAVPAKNEPKPLLLTQYADERTIAGIRDGAIADLTGQATAILQEIAEAEAAETKMTRPGIKARADRLSGLREKMGAYRSILGEAATQIEEGIMAAEVALVRAQTMQVS